MTDQDLDRPHSGPSSTKHPPECALRIITRVPIPAKLPHNFFLERLRAYDPLIVANPFLKTYERRKVPLDELVNDPFFSDDGFNLRAYVVTDAIPIIPGVSWLKKDVSIPCVFQGFHKGVRCRAQAQAGVMVRSSYEVRRLGEITEGPQLVRGPGDGDYELVETASIDCSSFIKFFVKSNFSEAHKAILQSIVNESERVYEEDMLRVAEVQQSQQSLQQYQLPSLQL